MSSFLPEGEKIPESKGNYLKLKEGATKFRVVSDAITGYEFWTNENKPVRTKEKPKAKPENVRLEKDGSYNVKYFWAFKVLDRKDNLVKIFEITQTGIMRQMQALLDNEDWGDPKNYDITITGTGDGLERRYTVQPSPHKELTAEEKGLVARTEIDLNQLYQGENPFIAPVDDDLKLEDVPF